jgi:hypothetical protein
MERSHEYDDIISLPHHVSAERPHMPMIDRAAQFAPFAALTGYGAAIEEAARLTDQKLELDEEQKQVISKCLFELQGRIKEHPAVALTYFIQDPRKSGGKYKSGTVAAEKVDGLAGVLYLADGEAVSFDDIYTIEIVKKTS